MAASLLVLISGSGSNLQAIIDATQSGILKDKAVVKHVLSNRKKAFGLERAAKAGIPTSVHTLLPYKKEHGDEEGRRLFDEELGRQLVEHNPSLIVCAGWMHILSPIVLNQLSAHNIPIINLHPALPNAFNGIHAIERAYEASRQGKINETGCMVHWVIAEVDGGKPIAIQRIPITQDDTVDSLEAKIHAEEHKLLVQAIHDIVTGAVPRP
ncbi:phosphoribosylglycinamide formyltransferase [Schizosaccharomyces japonicus yFS275]|uniref:phosphoribosylglycinamide formyltransferase 1 n=1 Tax=Schizosaccharomyces japonicus (strain yFS275 / FY16936) TaxID=402676 RepID=B6JYZ1_SCHJY|nr:phosphoribosylglycinamide formyltransferase [Schizosaccharomyces japonicus yFS275]EEB06759.1 phosphoribosylglycinamide formyltransferase [Schizosaccharomyces japonicus yFS275]